MCRISFYAKLKGNKYIYWEDLGGLCHMYSQYDYKIFLDLILLIQKQVAEAAIQVCKYCEINVI